MPAVSLTFRASCGCFVAVFIRFMFGRAKKKAESKCRTLRPRTRKTGVMVGLTLLVFFWSNLLMQCGDIEVNPGPPKHTKQTRLTSSSSLVSLNNKPEDSCANEHDERQETGPELSLKDVMTMLNGMNTKIDTLQGNVDRMQIQFDKLHEDVADMMNSFSAVQKEMQALSHEVTSLRNSNDELQESNRRMKDQLMTLEAKADDLENRSKRNNIIIHGIPRNENESPEECQRNLKDMITNKLDIHADFSFDRVHRLNAKKDSPIIARCTFYKDKIAILKAKRKLKDTNVFVGEDFSQRVRSIRKKLSPHLKTAKEQGKRATMIYDHLIIEGKKFFLAEDETNIRQMI